MRLNSPLVGEIGSRFVRYVFRTLCTWWKSSTSPLMPSRRQVASRPATKKTGRAYLSMLYITAARLWIRTVNTA